MLLYSRERNLGEYGDFADSARDEKVLVPCSAAWEETIQQCGARAIRQIRAA